MKKLIEKLRRDSWGMGIFLGLVVPAITFAIFLGLFALALHLAPRTEAVDVFDINTDPFKDETYTTTLTSPIASFLEEANPILKTALSSLVSSMISRMSPVIPGLAAAFSK